MTSSDLEDPAARFHAFLPDELAAETEVLERVADWLAASHRPLIVCGTGVGAAGLVDLAADAALLLTAASKRAGLFYILPEANSFAAGWLAQTESTTDRMLKAASQRTGW